eukprot:gene13723-biopygen11091
MGENAVPGVLSGRSTVGPATCAVAENTVVGAQACAFSLQLHLRLVVAGPLWDPLAPWPVTLPRPVSRVLAAIGRRVRAAQ